MCKTCSSEAYSAVYNKAERKRRATLDLLVQTKDMFRLQLNRLSAIVHHIDLWFQTLQYFIGCTKKAVCTFAECLCAQCAYELVQMRGSQLEDWHATASYRNCPTDPTLRKLLIIKIQQFTKEGLKVSFCKLALLHPLKNWEEMEEELFCTITAISDERKTFSRKVP